MDVDLTMKVKGMKYGSVQKQGYTFQLDGTTRRIALKER
jgi:hypothetical protein